MKRLLILTIALILTVCLSKSARLFACSCNYNPSFYWHYNSSDKIFKGKVLSIQTFKDIRTNIILFKILTKYKGNNVIDTVSLTTGLGNGDCGLRVDTNDVWVIFSKQGYTGMCNANLLIERHGKSQTNWGMYNESMYIKPLEDILSKKTQYIKEYDSKKNRLLAEGQIINGIAEGYWNYHFEQPEDILFETATDTKIFYKNALKDSIEYQYYKSGELYSEQVWHKGKEDGKRIGYYPDGSINFSEIYVDGKKDGLWESFQKNGKHYSKEYYSLGKRVKTCTHFYENGDTSWVHYYDNNGKIINGMMKYENGKLQSIDTYHLVDSLYIQDDVTYYENGNTKRKSSGYQNDKYKWKYHGEQISYYENGTIKDKTCYDRGKEVGTWYYYDETGTLIKVENK